MLKTKTNILAGLHQWGLSKKEKQLDQVITLNYVRPDFKN